MRYFKLLLMGGIVLALTMPAAAITLVNGENVFKIINRDNGTVYTIPGGLGASIGSKVNVAAGVAALDLYGPKVLAVGGIGSEDSWGIAKTTTIHDSSGNVVWSVGVPNTELTWMFYGARDFYAQVTGATGDITTQSVGLIAQLWEEPLAGGTNINLTKGSAWRTGLTTYTGATEGTMLLELTSVGGFIRTAGDLGGALTEFETTFNAGSVSGGGVAYFDVTDGTLKTFFDTNTISTLASSPLYNNVPNCDAWIQFTSTPTTDGPNPSKPLGSHNPPYDWLVQSEDPVRTDVIPEPVTMASLLLGFGCLGRYIRKRR